MEEPIKKHYDDHEVLLISFNKNIENWIKELNFIDQELRFLKKMLRHSSILTEKRNTVDEDYLLNSVDKTIQFNTLLIAQTMNFDNHTMSIRECDDVNCETYFFNEHFEFQKKMAKHFDKVRNLRLGLFSFMEKLTL